MFKLFKTIAKAGTHSTIQYPFAPLEVCDDFRGKPEHDPEQCIACAACTQACPANALIMETDTENNLRRWEISFARCIYCGRCEEVCPTNAITLSQEFELAVTNKADLYEEANFTLAHCAECGEAYAPTKAVSYVHDLLLQSGLDSDDPRLSKLLNTCPSCCRSANMLDSKNLSHGQYFHDALAKDSLENAVSAHKTSQDECSNQGE
ncbi:hydrogenase 4 subunit H [Psychromonas sp. CNPT3]|uniref:formate hydrogenlyase complex iron-sulfur subunit n=1 Tax=Psychromonas sp. CNPT3 TaxID=314282 RepID=UPI00006E8920|nr:formate hydrogenlyase complex iron-sulfur subunit [Psychromonas sp. CNPT3]AGH82386.1 hydrogenase 4 subunit H [Psychromonas sp. CNPT3]